MARHSGISRRRVLKSAVWAAPLCLTGGLLQGCAKGAPQMADTAILELGARDAVAHIAKGDFKAEAYAKILLGQYAKHKDLNCVIAMDEAKVLEAARAVDQARAKGANLGAAGGLPFAVKDQIDTAEYPTTGGNGALKGNRPQVSAPVVAAVTKAGGIVFCKTAMPDMVAGGSIMATDASWNRTFGSPRNPYDLARITGGSSGGNGAILAARIAPAAIGEDSTGSVRLPGAFCGIAGLRPSTFTLENALSGGNKKRWSDDGFVVPPVGLIDTFGPMARTVADVAWLDTIVTGEATPTVNLRDVRIAIPRADYWESEFVDLGVAKVMQETLAKLRDAGAQLIEVDLVAVLEIANAKVNQAIRRPSGRDLAAWLETHVPGVTMEQVYDGLEMPAGGPRGEPMPDAERTYILTEAARAYAEVFKSNGIVAIAMPTMPITAPPLDAKGVMLEAFMVNGKLTNNRKVIPNNLNLSPRIGSPGLNIPAGLSDGLPVGLQLEGMPGDDTGILGLGIAVENVLGRIPAPTFSSRQV
jgi:Asp-tRNA(Asn)/Glu-tRNA(Gln) amidotransferase A subunit family amidase